MIINNKYSGLEFCPYVNTEKQITDLLIRDQFELSDDYELMAYPFANLINSYGLQFTNNFIKSLQSSKRRIFICQHILVHNLVFENSDIVFTPHASESDNFISIPHYTVNTNSKFISKNKKYKFAFFGSVQTHRVRAEIVKMYPDNCFDSGKHWGLDKSLGEDFRENYLKMIGESDFSLCPRGTGISSIRLFESMSMNSIPVIIADGFKKPLSNKLDWNKFSVTVGESQITKLIDVINGINSDKLESMRTTLGVVYNEFFSNENLHKTIITNLK